MLESPWQLKLHLHPQPPGLSSGTLTLPHGAKSQLLFLRPQILLLSHEQTPGHVAPS